MAERPYERIVVTRSEAVLTITLNYPERRNAIGPQMTNELLYALDDAQKDASVRVIVVTGAGKAFCAGGDFAQMTGGGDRASLPPRGDYADLLLALAHADKPVIAKVNGAAMGGGLGIVAASSFAIAADGAQLGTPEVDVGIFPMMIMAILGRIVPRRRLLRMMLLGERLGAAEACAIGIVGEVVAAGELDAATDKLAAALASKSPTALRLGLRAFAAQDDLALEDALPLLRGRLIDCIGTDDAREGLTAFLEKRAPKWTGK